MVLKYSVGLDVSSKDIKVCMSSIDEKQAVKVISTCTISNSLSGFKSLATWIKRLHKSAAQPVVVCMEATGVYHENCAYYLHTHDFSVSIILPNKAKKYLQAIGLKSKNDAIDAKGLAQMGAEQNLSTWQPPGAFFYGLKLLTRQYQSVQESITAEKNRLHAYEHCMFQNKTMKKQMIKMIVFLEKMLAETKEAIEAHIKTNEVIYAKFQKVCKIKGIAILSAATIIAETDGFELFSSAKQVVSFAGYDVIENQSGSHTGKTKISKKGNARIRRILHMPALVAMGKDDKFSNLCQRVYERTGIKMKGIVAVQKKLLVMVYHIWTKDIDYIENYENIQEKKQVFSSPLQKAS